MSKRKKLRVDFRKNRQNRRRQGDLTREVEIEGLDESHDLARDERLTGKGDLTRRRTILTDDEGTALRAVDESVCLRGRVLSAVGLTSLVQADDGRRFECTVRRVVRTMARDQRNVVVTGDEVLFLPSSTTTEGVVERVEPRRSSLSRRSQGHEHVIVANVDQAAIVVSASDPPLKPGLIDRFLVSADKGEVAPLVCINKSDLVERAWLQPIAGVYARLGIDVAVCSAATGAGIARLRSLLRGKQTVFTGQSGVGKSSLLNAVQPGLEFRTGEVGAWTRKGTHTTRRAILVALETGGWMVDTPGIRQLELWDVSPAEVEGHYLEFRPFVAGCRFPDCTHTHEAGCGVKQAVDDDLISPLRYESYCRLIQGQSGE